MGVIRTGIWNYFRLSDVAPLYVDLAGVRFYYDESPEQPIFPYCVFHVFDEVPERTFDLEFEDAAIQFNYYGVTADECDDGVVDIKTMFDYAILTLSGYTCLRLEREFVFDSSKIEPDDIWVGIVRYSLLMQKD